MFRKLNSTNGFTLVEVMVVLILLTLSFMVFLRALNTGQSVRANSEIRTIQGVILSKLKIKLEHEDLMKIFLLLGHLFCKDLGESIVEQFDDIDDFHNFTISSMSEYPSFSLNVNAYYVHPDTKLRQAQNIQTNYKNISISTSHQTLPTITDTIIISSDCDDEKRLSNGFTMIEIVLVIVIAGIIGSMALVYYIKVPKCI